LDQRPLGRTGRTLTGIGLGCVAFGPEIDETAPFRQGEGQPVAKMRAPHTFWDTHEPLLSSYRFQRSWRLQRRGDWREVRERAADSS
jgi:hypothetical protein